MLLKVLLTFVMCVFFLLVHPLFFSLNVVVLVLSCIINLKNEWFNWINYIIVLIYLGGVLILLCYISCMAPNLVVYQVRWQSVITLSVLALLFHQLFYSNLQVVNMTMATSNFLKFQSSMMFMLLLMLLVYLFMVLIYSVMFLKQNFGPLRTI